MHKCEIEEAMINYRKAMICGVDDEDLFSYLRLGFSEGYMTKDEYAFTLRQHQAAGDEMKSEGRDRCRSMVPDERLRGEDE